MNKKLNPINVAHGKGREIAKVFGCTPARVSQALRGRYISGLTYKIRHVALTQYEGREMQPINK